MTLDNRKAYMLMDYGKVLDVKNYDKLCDARSMIARWKEFVG